MGSTLVPSMKSVCEIATLVKVIGTSIIECTLLGSTLVPRMKSVSDIVLDIWPIVLDIWPILLDIWPGFPIWGNFDLDL